MKEIKDIKLRVVEVFKDNSWTNTRMQDLKLNDKFRMFEGDHEPVYMLEQTDFIAMSEPYIIEGVWGVRVK